MGNKFHYCDQNQHGMMKYSLKLPKIVERICLKERSLRYLLQSRVTRGVWRTHILLFFPCFHWKSCPALLDVFWEVRPSQGGAGSQSGCGTLTAVRAVLVPAPLQLLLAASPGFGASPFRSLGHRNPVAPLRDPELHLHPPSHP